MHICICKVQLSFVSSKLPRPTILASFIQFMLTFITACVVCSIFGLTCLALLQSLAAIFAFSHVLIAANMLLVLLIPSYRLRILASVWSVLSSVFPAYAAIFPFSLYTIFQFTNFLL